MNLILIKSILRVLVFLALTLISKKAISQDFNNIPLKNSKFLSSILAKGKHKNLKSLDLNGPVKKMIIESEKNKLVSSEEFKFLEEGTLVFYTKNYFIGKKRYVDSTYFLFHEDGFLESLVKNRYIDSLKKISYHYSYHKTGFLIAAKRTEYNKKKTAPNSVHLEYQYTFKKNKIAVTKKLWHDSDTLYNYLWGDGESIGFSKTFVYDTIPNKKPVSIISKRVVGYNYNFSSAEKQRKFDIEGNSEGSGLEFTFNSKHQLIEELGALPSEYSIDIYRYTYDSLGRLLYRNVPLAAMGDLSENESLSYDSLGNILSITTSYNRGDSQGSHSSYCKTLFTYNLNNMISSESYHYSLTYNSNPSFPKRDDIKRSQHYKFIYQYDDYGNWTERKKMENTRTVETIRRQIFYYK